MEITDGWYQHVRHMFTLHIPHTALGWHCIWWTCFQYSMWFLWHFPCSQEMYTLHTLYTALGSPWLGLHPVQRHVDILIHISAFNKTVIGYEITDDGSCQLEDLHHMFTVHISYKTLGWFCISYKWDLPLMFKVIRFEGTFALFTYNSFEKYEYTRW